jgi:S-adenosylmethionine:tRNA ribosyltransferase-isomerase
MKTDLFDFDLPPERIATHPVTPRDASKLLVADAAGLQDRMVRELPDLLRPGDLMVFNDTRVIPARLTGKRGAAAIEVTLHKHLGGRSWRVFARPGKRLKINDIIIFNNAFSALVTYKHEDGGVDIEWNRDDWRDYIIHHGAMPLPPYMKRPEEAADKTSYQTVYARNDGAVAAPTAGLHFTDALLGRLDERGIERAFITLHVGAGTFQPVKADDTDNHSMHTEYYEISEEIAKRVNTARKDGRRIVSVGTTSLRALESAADENGQVRAASGETGIFITPGYRFRAVDVLMTNFHLPRSTLFMLVSAFAGLERMKEAYAHAIGQNYRFYSYGDACLLVR